MEGSLFSDFLSTLGVPHTATYSNRQYAGMPFKTMFGLSKLLESYGIPNEAWQINDKEELNSLTPPFLADTPKGFVIVTSITDSTVGYLSEGEKEYVPADLFKKMWNGIVLLAFPDKDSREPGYEQHHLLEIASRVKNVALNVLTMLLFTYLFVTAGLWRSPWSMLLVILNIVGLVLSFMLVQKTLKIKNKAADKVCSALEEGGCDKVMEMKASSFFGIVSWSTVGLAYFSVSLLCLLIFPQWEGYLALCNVCCLPFTFWSIWYQKFRAKVWCTLCVSVQATLWLLFICYLCGGAWSLLLPLRIELFVLIAAYATVLLAIDRLMPAFDKTPKDYETEDNTTSRS